MGFLRLALRNIGDSPFRSWVVFFCAALVAGFALSATLVVRGAQSTLRLVLERLGADIMVVPAGAETRVEQALLMGVPATVWMPESVVARISALAGGIVGGAAFASAVYLFRTLLVRWMGVPFLFPAPLPLLGLALGGLALALASVTLATFLPTWKVSRAEPGTAMKEW
jgi:hypothetical protein